MVVPVVVCVVVPVPVCVVVPDVVVVAVLVADEVAELVAVVVAVVVGVQLTVLSRILDTRASWLLGPSGSTVRTEVAVDKAFSTFGSGQVPVCSVHMSASL